MGMYTDAVEDYKKAIRLEPKKSLYYNNLGFCYDLMKEYKNAIEEYNKAIAIDHNPAYYNNRAHAF